MSRILLLIGGAALFTISCQSPTNHHIMSTPQVLEPRFTVLTLGVDNLEKSFHFYHHGLGLPSAGIVGKEFKNGAVAFFDLRHGLKLALYAKNDLAVSADLTVSTSGPASFSIGYNVRTRAEVDAVLALARKAGAVIAKPAQDTFWAGYSGYFQDPDGHLWEIVWNPQLMPED
jgi:uncharacterized glyoxalase superfamily protein PhnB